MVEFSRSYYVLTGGPGTGKTTLLNELGQQGYITVPEVARDIIKHQVLNKGTALPWVNKKEYANLMWEASLLSYQNIYNTYVGDIVFFDRGILDTICYMQMENIPIKPEQEYFIKHSYYKKVFLLPPWEEIYKTDSERKQTWEEALYTYESMKRVYLAYNYDVIEVPKLSVEKRINFIREKL